jgi:hypothetical protein
MTDTNNEAEVLEYLRAFPDAAFSEVARALNIERHKVSSVAHKNGIYHRPRRTGMMGRRGKLPARRTRADPESEGKVVEYIKTHPKESYTVIGKRFGHSPDRLSQIARDHGIVRYAPRGQGGKKRRQIAKFLRKNTHIQVTENAKTLGISPAYVSTIATKHGLRRQAPKGSGLHVVGRVVRRTGALAIPSDDELDLEIRQAEQGLQQLRARKASLEIRIEEDGDTIIVYGVGEPIARHRADWLRWLKASGAALLREQCSKLVQASSAK